MVSPFRQFASCNFPSTLSFLLLYILADSVNQMLRATVLVLLLVAATASTEQDPSAEHGSRDVHPKITQKGHTTRVLLPDSRSGHVISAGYSLLLAVPPSAHTEPFLAFSVQSVADSAVNFVFTLQGKKVLATAVALFFFFPAGLSAPLDPRRLVRQGASFSREQQIIRI
jgi:hypothetical protein